ncbi:MAG: CDP-glycerol glycerophosphotransferase family protein [Bacteroidota bacterium]|nr:CDP-glycerol glycerophosphotransferase family protein [Bacteroidota bacterium]
MENLKKRVLIPIVGQGSITHIIRTGMLDMMSEFCKPVVALLWKEEELMKELQSKGYEITFFPAYKVSAEYAAVRYKINRWYLTHKLKTPSVNIQQKYLAQFSKKKQIFRLKKQLKDSYYSLRFKLQGSYIKDLLLQETVLMHKERVFAAYRDWLTLLNPSGLFTVTPFLHEVDLIGRILQDRKIPVIASIHSFDNVTKRGWPATIFDHYIVWNKYNKAELQRIYKDLPKDESVTVAGAPQFDFHYNNEFSWSREEWLQRLGLPADKKIILYGGGPVSLFPDEPQYLKTLKDAFEGGKIPKDYVVLFRCHPLDKVERWKQHVGESPHIFYDSAPNGATKLDYTNVLKEDIMNLMSTLKHSDVHINTISTMSVDGSAFKKPQIGPYYDEVNPSKQHLLRQMYYQEHYVPIMKSKVVHLAHSKAEFIDLVKRVAENPSAYTTNSLKCVEEIITFSDGKSTSRAVAAIKSFFER